MKINKVVFLGLIVYPILLLISFYYYLQLYGIGKIEFFLFALGHYVTNIAVGVGLHRMWAHSAFKTNKFIEFILTMLTAGAFQGPILAWVSDHYRHHAYTDQELDPHSPGKYSNKFKGFLWSHIGWMLFSSNIKSIDRAVIQRLGRNKLLVWQLKYYWYLVFCMHIIIPVTIGYVFLGNNPHGMITSWLFLNLGRAFQQQMTFCVNSICHLYGSHKYSTGTEGDIGWLAPFLLGENWHNFHHAFPKDYRNGVKWYHFDVHKWIIFCMEKFKLAWDLNRTEMVRIKAKIEDTANNSQQAKERWNSLLQKCDELKIKLKNKLYDLEKIHLTSNTSEQLHESYKKICIIFDKVKKFTAIPEKSSDTMFRLYQDQLRKIEAMFSSSPQSILGN